MKKSLQRLCGALRHFSMFYGKRISAESGKVLVFASASVIPVVGGNSNKILDSNECLKHACLLNVNSASSLLTTTIFSIEIVAEKYINALKGLTNLLDECVLLNGWSDELWDSVIALRSDATDLKSELTTLETYMNSVNKVVTSAIEASFNINANYICTTLCEHSHSAEEKMQKLEKEIKEVEESYLIALTAVAKYRQPNKKDEE